MSTIISKPPSRPATTRMGQYLYAVINCGQDRAFGGAGMDGAAVRAISDGRIAAVVSEMPNARIRPERRRLAAHHDVLKQLQAEHTVLPMSFGLIADDEGAVRRILSLNRDSFEEQLAHVAGKVEMGLRVLWDVPNIFEFFVTTHPELRALRDQFFHAGRQPSQEDMIELGRTFDRLLGEERAAHTRSVLSVLRPRCSEFKENKPRHEREVMNLACLLSRDSQREFEEGVFQAAHQFDNHYSFDINGPWPPHNFVEINLDL